MINDYRNIYDYCVLKFCQSMALHIDFYRLIMFIAIIIYEVKALYKVKPSGQRLSFNIFCFTSTCAYNKNKLCKISDI